MWSKHGVKSCVALSVCTVYSVGIRYNTYVHTCLSLPAAARQELTDEFVLEELRKSKATSLEKDHLVRAVMPAQPPT